VSMLIVLLISLIAAHLNKWERRSMMKMEVECVCGWCLGFNIGVLFAGFVVGG
jgi:hypothetical protein